MILQVTYRGSVEALQGKRFDVPAGVPRTQMAAWIESQIREQKAREAAALAKAQADAEAQAREAELLSARIQAAKSGEAFRTDLNALQAEVDEVKAQLEPPDAKAILSMNAAVLTSFTTAKEVLEKVENAIAQAEQLQASAVALLDEAQQAREASVQTIRNQQEAINTLFSGYRDSLDALQSDTNAAAAAVGELNTSAQDHRETIAAAARDQGLGCDMDLSNRIQSTSDLAEQLEQINAWLELNPGELSPEAITALNTYAGAAESMLNTGNALLQIGRALNTIDGEAGAGP